MDVQRHQGAVAIGKLDDALVAALGERSTAILKDALAVRPAAFVGGWVRDTLLGRPSADVDLACADPDGFTEALQQAGAKRAVLLDSERRTWRVVLAKRRFVDVSALKGPSLEEDLKARDLSINAIAWTPADGLVDPLGGRADLEAGRIRLAAPDAIQADRLRAVRAVRFAAVLGFSLDESLLDEFCATSLKGIAAERVKTELETLLRSTEAVRGFRLLAETGLLSQVLPACDLDRFERVLGWGFASPALARCLAHARQERDGELALRLGWLLDGPAREELMERRWPKKVVRRATTVSGAQGAEDDSGRVDALMSWTCGAAFGLLGIAARQPDEAAAEAAVAPFLALLDQAAGHRNPKDLPVPPLPKPLLSSREIGRHVGGPGPRVGEAARGLMRAQLRGIVRSVEEARAWLKDGGGGGGLT